jgi:ammonium transporter Rh
VVSAGQSVFQGGFAHKHHLSIETLVRGDFAAGSVLITFGVLLGKVNPPQILFIAIVETIFFTLNEHIGLQIGVADLGGTMTIHMFGAAFGMAASLMMTPKEARGHENNAANYHSDILAMVGTIFLWMYWPSFNAALGVGATQERAIINTVLGLCGSCVVAFLASHVLRRERRFNMVDIVRSTN